jgi:succinoglycan biosynthesis transport protein ExoP
MTVKPNIEIAPPDQEMLGGFSPSRETFRIADLLRMLRVRWPLIAGTAVIAVVLAALYVFTAVPMYTASATVMLDQRKNNITDISAVLSGLTDDSSVMPNQAAIITSRAVAGRVVSRLKLTDDPEFNSDLATGSSFLHYLNPRHWLELLPSSSSDQGGQSDQGEEESTQDQVIDAFLDDLGADPGQSATTVEISFMSQDPGKAARIANAVADAYVEDELNTKFDAAQKTAQWLGARLGELSHQVSTADAEVQSYKTANNLTEIPNPGAEATSVVDQQVSGIAAQLVLAKADLAEKEAQYSRVVDLAKSGRADDVSAVVQSPLITQLRGQETDLLRQEADMASVYGSRHPKMLDLESQKRNLQAKISEEVQRVVQTVASDVVVARARVNSLDASLGHTSSTSQNQTKLMAHLAELEATANTARTLYQGVLSHYNDALSQTGIQTPDTRVLSKAVLPDKPSSPRKALDLGAAALIGLLLGLALAFAADRLDIGFRTAHQIEAAFGLPVLAAVPAISDKDRQANPADEIIRHPTSAFTEAVRGISLGLKLSNPLSQTRIVTITSSVPGEGKTIVATSLARLLANEGRQRVLLIDADLRKPAVAKALNLPTSQGGTVEALAEPDTAGEYIAQDPRSKLRVLCSPQRASNAPDLLRASTMRALIERLKPEFDLIVIDSAPLLPVHDSWPLAEISDSVLLAVRWEKTPREAASRSVQILQEMKAQIGGIALTRVDTRSFYYYNYGYQDYSSYEKYYNPS